MNSIEFVRTRAQASRSAQVILAAAPTNPTWLWGRKTILQWTDDLAVLDQLRVTVSRSFWVSPKAWDTALKFSFI